MDHIVNTSSDQPALSGLIAVGIPMYVAKIFELDTLPNGLVI